MLTDIILRIQRLVATPEEVRRLDRRLFVRRRTRELKAALAKRTVGL